ncbi:Immunoglobulin C-2 Type [Porites harrisoni]
MARLIPMVGALLVMTVGRSEAIIWQEQPEKPTILVEGVNNTQDRQKLVWNYVQEPSETIERVTFQRRRDDADPAEDIAIISRKGAFNVFSKFISNYSASPPATLILRNPVTNDDEFIYSIVVSLSRNDRPLPSVTDKVQLIVFVPPRITTEPQRESKVSVGENLTLTCSASGDPLPEVTWSKEGQVLRLFNVTGPVLHLVKVTREDFGSYKCTAKNKVGEASRPALVNIACPENQCEDHEFGIRITSVRWRQAFNNSNAIEYKTLKSAVASEIAKIYTQSQNTEKQLYGITIVEFREGSTIAVVRLRFERNISDPLKPLEDAIKDGILGRNRVDTQLLNTTIHPPPPSTTTMHLPSPSTTTMHPPRPSTTRPRFAFTISCFPSYMVAHIARDSLPSGADVSLLHLNDPSCGVSYLTKKSVIIKAPLKGCGTVRRYIGYKMFFYNKVVVPSGYDEKRSLSVFPFKCVYSRFGFP